MTDALAEMRGASREQIYAMYETILSEHELLPAIPVNVFYARVAEVASSNADVDKVLRLRRRSDTHVSCRALCPCAG